MSSSSSGITGSGRETVRISLGPSANAVSSHLSNLEGMACTTATAAEDDDNPGSSSRPPPLCDPHVTHREFRGYLVPRCIFVDSRDGFSGGGGGGFGEDGGGGVVGHGHYHDDSSSPFATPASMVDNGAYHHNHGGGCVGLNGTFVGSSSSSNVVATSSAWGGEVERVHRHLLLDHIDRDGPQNRGTDADAEAHGVVDPFGAYRLASARAAASRFDCSSSGPISSYEGYSTRHRYASHSSNDDGRHVNWDDQHDDQEAEEEYSDEEEAARVRDGRIRAAIDRRTALEVDATVAWEEACSSASASASASLGRGNGAGTSTCQSSVVIPWRDYLAVPPNSMPPSSMLELPFYSSSTSSSSNDATFVAGSFFSGYSPSSQTNHPIITREWREDGMSESIRSILEECDTVQGFQILADDDGMYAGLASSVLEELTDECRSAARLSVLVSSNSSSGRGRSGGVAGAEGSRRGIGGRNDTSSSWAARTSFRRMLNDGLSLHGVASRSDAVLPIDLALCSSALGPEGKKIESSCQGTTATVFKGGAAAALALEASTLPYRLLGSSPRDGRVAMAGLGAVGGVGVDGDDTFPTSTRIGYRRFVSDLLGGPSGRHNVLSMDGRLRPLPGGATTMTKTMTTTNNLGGDAQLPPAAAMLLASLGRGTGDASGAGGGGRGDGELYRLLASGTSVGRTGRDDPRLRSRLTTATAAEPGAWIDGDLLSPLSLPRPRSGIGCSGQEHTNYALHASLRPSHDDLPLAANTKTKTDPVHRYIMPLMESLAARRPTDGFSSCVVGQSVDGLTSGGYGYWRSSVFVPDPRHAPLSPSRGGGTNGEGGSGHRPSPEAPAPPAVPAAMSEEGSSTIASSPILSLLSNSTRIHPYLHLRVRGLKRALSRPYRGYHNAESASGLAPEREDCDDAVEYLVDLDGAYDSGMDLLGVVDDLDGDDAAYFDSNED